MDDRSKARLRPEAHVTLVTELCWSENNEKNCTKKKTPVFRGLFNIM